MGALAFLFAGQGAQHPGMGRELCELSPAASHVFEVADTLRPGTSAQTFSGTSEELTITANTQPCLFCTDLAAAEALRASGFEPDAVAGFSLGEVAALTFAHAMTLQDGFSYVVERGRAMQDSAEAHPGAMVAVVKLDDAVVEDLCRRFDQVYPVNYNCPGQLVVAGVPDELELFKAVVKEAGGRAIPLAVSGGFHSPFMREASATLATVLEHVALCAPQMPVYANLDAQPYPSDTASIRSAMASQVSHPVRWRETIERMRACGIDTFVEVGPGKTLSGLVKKIDADATVLRVADAATFEETCNALRA